MGNANTVSDRDLEAYDRYFEACRKAAEQGRASEVIFNRNADHAAILIKHLILSAKKSIQILSGSLTEEVYGQPIVIDALRAFMSQRAAHAQILLDWEPSKTRIEVDELWQSHALLKHFKRISEADRDRLGVLYVPEPVAKRYSYHFLVADNASYRFEENRTEYDAIAQFHNLFFGSELSSRFGEIWNLSKS